MEGFIVPSKFYGILATGKPIIFLGDIDGELAYEVKKISCGAGVKIGDVQSLVEIITLYSKDIESIQKMGLRGREAFENSYDFPISENKFLLLFDEINSSEKDANSF